VSRPSLRRIAPSALDSTRVDWTPGLELRRDSNARDSDVGSMLNVCLVVEPLGAKEGEEKLDVVDDAALVSVRRSNRSIRSCIRP
jgi:hypothetical protein